MTVTIDAIPVSVEIKAEQDVRTSNQKTGQSFTMQDGLNIIRKFGAVGWCKNVCGGAAELQIPDEDACAVERVLRNGLTRGELAYGR